MLPGEISVDMTHNLLFPGGKEESRLTEWKNFFLDSGIPDHASAEYAAIFVKERINWQILKNLDKGYLTDMGINCIGDQIAILQAAKRYCGEQYHPSNTGTLFKPPVEANGSDIMEVEETVHHSNNSPRNQNSNTVASEVPQASQVCVISWAREVLWSLDYTELMIRSVG